MAGFLLAPLKRYLSDLLAGRLAEYVTGVEVGDLGVLGADLVIGNVGLRLESLQRFIPAALGLTLTHGTAAELRIAIPWTALLSAPIVVRLSRVVVACRFSDGSSGGGGGGGGGAGVPKAAAAASPVAGTPAAATPARAPRPAGASPVASLPAWLQSRLTRVLANVVVKLEDVSLRVEAGAGSSVYVAAHAQSLEVTSADFLAGWRAGFVDPVGAAAYVGKAVTLRDLMVECNSVARRPRGGSVPSVATAAAAAAAASDDSASHEPPVVSFSEEPLLARTNVVLRLLLPLVPAAVGQGGSGRSPPASPAVIPPRLPLIPVARPFGGASPPFIRNFMAATAAAGGDSPRAATRSPHESVRDGGEEGGDRDDADSAGSAGGDVGDDLLGPEAHLLVDWIDCNVSSRQVALLTSFVTSVATAIDSFSATAAAARAMAAHAAAEPPSPPTPPSPMLPPRLSDETPVAASAASGSDGGGSGGGVGRRWQW